jgi:hypothetical protein
MLASLNIEVLQEERTTRSRVTVAGRNNLDIIL